MKTTSTLFAWLSLGAVVLMTTPAHTQTVMSDGQLVFSAVLSGDEEVPPVTTNAKGVASFKLSAGWDSLWVNVSFDGLSSGITGAHIHNAEAGSNGSVVINLGPYRTDSNIQGVVTGSVLTDQLIASMIKGETYINVHTSNNTGGEIRGQIMLEADHLFYSVLNGANEVPAVSTPAYGLATVAFDQNFTQMSVMLVMQDLSDSFTAAHFHVGAVGTTGIPVLDIEPYRIGNVIAFEMEVTSSTTILLDSLLAGRIYINVHTAANPNGEIRGQLMPVEGLAFATVLSGDAEVPPVTTDAVGVAVVSIDPGTAMMWYHAVVDGLSGAITGAHFHEAEAGASGGVVIGITDSVAGNRISGSVSGIALTRAFIQSMLMENIYMNVHTAANTGGEIRGQMTPMYRPGDIFALCGSQEVPPITTDAFGSAVVSLGRVASGLHYRVAYNNIPDFTAAHFHNAEVGVSGGVVHNITSSFNGNVAEGYWADTGATAFDANALMDLMNGDLYINIHSTQHTSGEIRGQLMSDEDCSPPVGIREQTLSEATFSIYPVPVDNTLFISITPSLSGNLSLALYDIQGRKIYQNVVNENKAGPLSLDMSRYPSGLYMLSLTNANGEVVSQRLIKD